jgi:hypothetical protein
MKACRMTLQEAVRSNIVVNLSQQLDGAIEEQAISVLM